MIGQAYLASNLKSTACSSHVEDTGSEEVHMHMYTWRVYAHVIMTIILYKLLIHCKVSHKV